MAKKEKGKPEGITWQEVAELHELIKQFGRADRPFDPVGEKLIYLEYSYKQYQSKNPLDRLPQYNKIIEENLFAITLCMARLNGTNDQYTKACEGYSDLVNFLESLKLCEIKFKADEKGKSITIKNRYLLEAIIIHLTRRQLPVIKLKPPKKANSKQLLSRFLDSSLSYISQLKTNGVTDDFIVHFINSTPLFSATLDYSLVDFYKVDGSLSDEEAALYRSILDGRQSQIKVNSVEAFRKALIRAKTKPHSK